MKSFNGMLMTLVTVGSMALSQTGYAALVLPAPGGGLSRANGDFEVYSLPFLENLFGSGFSVQSSPGQIQDGIVIMTGASGGPVNNNPSGMDDAYGTPSGTSGLPYFRTGVPAGDFPDPSGDPSVDSATRWDADVAAVRTLLGGGDLVFFFNLNDTNATDADGVPLPFEQDQLAWAQLDLIDSQGILPTLTFYLSAADDPLTGVDEHAAGLLASQVLGAPDPNPTTNPSGTSLPAATLDDQWSYVHGIITVAADGSFLHYGPTLPGDPAGASEIDQNLGADHAAFAMFNQTLNDLVQNVSSGYERISIDIRLSRLNNGYEQAFILPGITVNQVEAVPEPWAVLTWVGLSAIGGAVAWRRRS
jgi:hypothetical protein